MDKKVKKNGVDTVFTFTVGFYGPQNGPYPKSEPVININSSYPYNDPIYKEIYDDWKNPYAVIRITSDTGRYYITTLSRLKISKTGNKVSESRSEAYYKYYKDSKDSYSFMRSFNISVDKSGLTISGVRMIDNESGRAREPDYDADDDYYILEDYLNQINGTYRRGEYNPKFTFNEGQQRVWDNIRNTAWAKQGETTPSIGFYELEEGPAPVKGTDDRYSSYLGYVFLNSPDGSSKIYIERISNDGIYIYTRENYYNDPIRFKINIDNNNTLSISNIRFTNNWWGEGETQYLNFSDSFARYTEQELGAYFNSTYTKTNNDNWDTGGRTSLWNQIKNTAWKKNGEDFPSIGFYLRGKGPASSETNAIYDSPGSTANDGYVYFMTPDGTTYSPLTIVENNNYEYDYSLSINLNGNLIKTASISFKITVTNNDGITISNIKLAYNYDGTDIYFYFYNKDGYGNNSIYTDYTVAQLNAYFNGTYTKVSDDPDYLWK